MACKKDAIQIIEDKHYSQINAPLVADPQYTTAISLTLKPNGTGYIAPGGDIMHEMTYDVSGKKITVKLSDKYKYRFDIISDQELHGPNGEVLKLQNR
jgi:hypothetical protein